MKNTRIDWVRATRYDVVELSALANVIWRQHYSRLIGEDAVEYMLSTLQSPEAIEEQMEDDYIYFFIRSDEENIGYTSVQLRNNGLYISKFYVLIKARGVGAGRKTMNFLEHLAKGEGLTRIYLNVNKNNDSIQKYKKMGFSIYQETVIDIGEGFVMDDFEMEKRLD